MALQKSGLELVAEGQAQYISQIAAADRATNTFAKGVTDSAAQVNAAADTIGKATANASGLYQDAAGKWRNASGQFASDAEKAAAGVVAATDKVGSQGGKGFEALENIARGALERVGHIAVDALGQAAQAAGQFAADSITAAGDFEASVNNLAAISGTALADAGFNFDDVSAKALQLGQDTAFSASESIEAMTNLVKGGVPVADVMNEATDATLALAAASGTDLASAADIVAKQLGVWGETGLTATAAADLLTQAANASTVGVEDLAQGLSQAGGTAKTAGVEYDDLVQTMALLAPGFSSASDAGTSLKTFLSRLVPSTKAATEEMMALGLATADGKSKFYDAEGSFIGMEAAAALLAKQTANLSEEQRLAAFNTIFGSDAIRAASAIANSGAEGFNAMGEAMAGAGTAAETAAIQNQGFNFAMDSLKGSVETLQIVIGSALLPILTQLINDYLIPGVGVVMQFAQALFGNTDALAALSPQMQGAVAGVQSFLAAAQPVAEFLIANWQPALAAVAGVIGAIAIPALVAMVAPFAPIIAAVGAAIAIGAALQTAWNTNFLGIQGYVTTALTNVQATITAVLGVVSEFWAANGEEISATTEKVWSFIEQVIGVTAAVIAAGISTTFGAIANFLTTHGDQIQAVLEFAWESIEAAINLTINTIQGVVAAVLAVIEGDWEGAAEAIMGIVDGFQTYIGDTFDNIANLVEGLGGRAAEAGAAFIRSMGDGILSAIDRLIQQAKDALAELADLLPGSEPKDPTSPLRGLSKRGAAFMQNFVGGAVEAAPAAASAMSGALATVAAPAAASSYSSTSYSYGPSYSIDARGSTLNEGQIEAAFTRALYARTSRADRLARTGGGAG